MTPAPAVRFTVAICTWNRAALLRQTLAGLVRARVPAGVTLELLVVNNNCTDDTDAVIASFAGVLPVRRLFEPAPGLSHARNHAVREATGDYILWTDDDVLVAADWLQAYHDAFTRWPEAVVFGGPITPWFPEPPPAWLESVWPRVASAYASIDYGAEAVPLTAERVPFGANYAMRGDVQRALRYDTDLGVRPGGRMGGEETDVVRRALAAGGAGWWVPAAAVRHYIPPARQTVRYLRGWFRAYGEYLGREVAERGTPHLFGRPRWLWKQAVTAELRYQLARRASGPTEWIEHLIVASRARGQLSGYRRPA